MGTKSIDSIQTEQIEYLEADVTELLGKTNLLIGDINVLVPKLNDTINNLKNFYPAIVGTGYSAGSSGNGLLKRLTEFDDDYTEHISSKFPPFIDFWGVPRIGYKSGGVIMPLTHRGGDEHQAFSDGWECQDGTCVTATVVARITGDDPYPSSLWGMSIGNIRFMPSDHVWTTYDGYWNWPNCEIAVDSYGVVTSSNFHWDKHAYPSTYHPQNSYGFGWSVGDTMHSDIGPNDQTAPRWFSATVTSVGSQCIQLPEANLGELRSPSEVYTWNNGYIQRSSSLFGSNDVFYGGDAPGMGGISEPAPPAAGSNSETSTHNVMDNQGTEDEDAYDANAVSASTDRAYKDESSVLFLEDTAKATRAKKLVRTTLNKLRSK